MRAQRAEERRGEERREEEWMGQRVLESGGEEELRWQI